MKISVSIATLAVCSLLTACGGQSWYPENSQAAVAEPARPTATWVEGNLVVSVVTNQEGQIIDTTCVPAATSCTYDVRFNSQAGLVIVQHMHPYELKDFKKNQ